MSDETLEKRLKHLAECYHKAWSNEGRADIDGTAGYNIFSRSTAPPVVEEYLAKYNFYKQDLEKLYKRK